jgi:SOUL heme-binding protein
MRHLALLLPFSLLGVAADSTQAADPKPAASKVKPKPADGDAPLAEGFPDATEPGKIEVKKYSAYRSAVTKANKATVSSGDLMFFSLFNHIQKNKVEMTAPVINTFKTPRMIETPGTKGEVTMEFVYRSSKEGKSGPDGSSVEVVDHPAQSFVCLGFQGGNLSADQMREAVATLRKWLDEHKGEWVEDGPPRRLGYHGPMTPAVQRLWEVQIPVKAAGSADKRR